MDDKVINPFASNYMKNAPPTAPAPQMTPAERIAQLQNARQSTFTDLQYHQSPSRRPLSPTAQDILDYPSLRLYYHSKEAVPPNQQQIQRPLHGYYPNEIVSNKQFLFLKNIRH